MIVVDASVAVKWLIEEQNSSEALRLLADEDELFGPDLLAIEVGSAVTRRINMGDIASEDGFAAMQTWWRLLSSFSLQLLETPPVMLEEALHLAVKLRHPFKDAVYLALAMDEEAELVTSDRRFLEKGRAVYPRIHHLLEPS